MTTRSEILTSYPIGKGLDSFRTTHASNSIDEGNQDVDNEGLKNTILDLIHALQGLPASRLLPSKRGNRDLLGDLLSLSSAVYSDNFDTARIRPLLDAVLKKQPDEVIWDAAYDAVTESTPPPRPPSSILQTPRLRSTSSPAKSTDHRENADDVSNIRESISTSASLLRSPFARLPPEIRCLIYRILLHSETNVRMIPPPQDGDHTPCPNNLYPSILGTCRLICGEARYILYGENVFHAHRIDDTNHNAALIRRARYRIGLRKREDGEDEARKLADFLEFQRELRLLELEFRFDLIEDSHIYDLAYQAIQGHRHLMDIKILSPLVFSEMGRRHSWRLWRLVENQALLRE